MEKQLQKTSTLLIPPQIIPNKTDEKVVNYSNVTEIIKTVLNDDGSVFIYEERKTDPSQEDYIKYIKEYTPEDNDQK